MKTAINIVGKVTWSRQNTHTGQGQQVAITKTGCGGERVKGAIVKNIAEIKGREQ
jgi:hypothetical protein